MTFGFMKYAGIVTVTVGLWNVHVGVRNRADWVWGREESWYDGPIYYYGLGPALLVCWADFR